MTPKTVSLNAQADADQERAVREECLAVCDVPTARPTTEDLNTAWRLILDERAEPAPICDLSVGVIAAVAKGSPDYAPDRYSASEVNFARALLICAGAVARVRALMEGK